MRLIDADKLKKHYAWWDSVCAMDELKERKKDFDAIIDLQPTIEAKPIRHGHWIEYNMYGELHYKCSVCGAVKLFRTFYCCECGAKMDKEE